MCYHSSYGSGEYLHNWSICPPNSNNNNNNDDDNDKDDVNNDKCCEFTTTSNSNNNIDSVYNFIIVNITLALLASKCDRVLSGIK